MTGGEPLEPPEPTIKVGEKAPEFVLKDQHKREH